MEQIMADEWKTEFSIEDDGFAYATVTHDGETQKQKLGPGGSVIAEAMAWVEYNDVRETFTERTLRDVANFFEVDRERSDIAGHINAVADELSSTDEVPSHRARPDLKVV